MNLNNPIAQISLFNELIPNNFKNILTSPFLKYPGGKRWLLKETIGLIPEYFNNFHEPFLGSGAFYFFISGKYGTTKKYFLSDVNDELITTYQVLQKNSVALFEKLNTFENNKSFFDYIKLYEPENEMEIASRFLYLNRTCFGGIYRVNKTGKFNVPYGNRNYKFLFDFKNLELCSKSLNANTFINMADFRHSLAKIKQNDFVFFDPPYLGKNISFNRYNTKIFSFEDLEYIKFYLEQNKKVKFILCLNNDANNFELFKNLGDTYILENNKHLSQKLAKAKSQELIIKNF